MLLTSLAWKKIKIGILVAKNGNFSSIRTIKIVQTWKLVRIVCWPRIWHQSKQCGWWAECLLIQYFIFLWMAFWSSALASNHLLPHGWKNNLLSALDRVRLFPLFDWISQLFSLSLHMTSSLPPIFHWTLLSYCTNPPNLLIVHHICNHFPIVTNYNSQFGIWPFPGPATCLTSGPFPVTCGLSI